jgi:hypothetical protein
MTSLKVFGQAIACGAAVISLGVGSARAEETIKIGFSAPITGPFAENGKQMSGAEALRGRARSRSCG